MKKFCSMLALWALALASSVHAQPQGRSILDQTVQQYRDLQQYYFDGSISVSMHAANQQHGMEISLLMAGREPDDIRVEVDGEQMQLTVVSNGDTTWMYVPGLQQYVKRAGPFDPMAAAGAVPDLLSEYRTLNDNVRQVSLLREETLRLEDGPRASYVLLLEYEPRPSPAGMDSTRKTLWIDQERLVILKDSTRAHLSGAPPGSSVQGPVVIQETTVFSRARINEPLPDSLFLFTPPVEAVQVDPSVAAYEEDEGFFSGRPAEDFTLRNLDGEAVSLESLRGNVVLVNFWATWCGPCRTEMPVLEQLYKEFEEDGLKVLGVAVAEPAEDVRAYLQEHGYSFPVLLDEGAEVAALYQADAIPMTLIIDREGTIVHHFVGARPEAIFRNALKGLGLE